MAIYWSSFTHQKCCHDLYRQNQPNGRNSSACCKNGLTANYFALYNLFNKGILERDVYDTLEAASRAVCPSSIAIYSSVMARKYTGVPGIGFYDVFQNTHPEEYFRIAGKTILQNLTNEMMIEMTDIERRKVYEHADQYYFETDF